MGVKVKILLHVIDSSGSRSANVIVCCMDRNVAIECFRRKKSLFNIKKTNYNYLNIIDNLCRQTQSLYEYCKQLKQDVKILWTYNGVFTLNLKIMNMNCQQNCIIQMILIIILMNLHCPRSLHLVVFMNLASIYKHYDDLSLSQTQLKFNFHIIAGYHEFIFEQTLTGAFH